MKLLPESTTGEKVFKLNFKLTPAQSLIDSSDKRFTFIRAGRKFGKTKYSELKALKWLGKPNSVHWHVAPTYKQARLISWGAFKRLIPKEIVSKVNDNDLFMQLKNGSQLFLMGSDDKDSLRGPSPTSMTLEEAAYHRDEVWAEILEPNLSVHEGPALFISTPKGFNWFKDLEDAAKDNPDWASFHFTIYDNPYINRAEIERIRAKSDPRVWSQEYMAEYESSVGRVFHDFQDTPRHVFAFVPVLAHEVCYRAIDWGMRDDTAALWAFIRDKKLYVYREHAENSLPASTQARIILNKTPKSEKIERNIIGHDAAKQDNEMRGLTVQWQFSNEGVRPLQTSSRKKDMSRDMIQRLLTEDRLVIHPDCRKLRKQLLSYSWKDTAMEKPEDGGDDLVDALHHLAELLQYTLFAGGIEKKEVTLEEMYAEITREKAAQQIRRYPLVQESNENVFDQAEGSQAGYV